MVRAFKEGFSLFEKGHYGDSNRSFAGRFPSGDRDGNFIHHFKNSIFEKFHKLINDHDASDKHDDLTIQSEAKSILAAQSVTDIKGLPTDPGLTSGDYWGQWHHTGQYGINDTAVWQDYTGAGVLIGLIDDGFNYNHSELNAHYRTDLDYDVLNNDIDSINDVNDVHGTYVAQVLAGDDNGQQGVGVAFDADIVGVRRGFGNEGSLTDLVEAFQYALDHDFDIVNNSWGMTTPFADDKKINFFGTDTLDVINKFEDLVEFGRDGLGANIVFSGGNFRQEGMSTNYKNYQNSPYTITVGSINESGTYSYFSEAGANLLVVAPGENILTSDPAGGDSAHLVTGTSFSAPLVSGIIALMLEANPDLGYRDVQEILAMSSRQIDASGTGWAEQGWQTNGATNWNGGGMHFSHDYGFGLVDAQAAVRLAETWNLQQTFTNMTVIPPISATPALAIPDSGSITTSITVSEDIQIEHILIDLNITHGKAGDLVITLISPDGTESVLAHHVSNGAFVTSYGLHQGIKFEFSSVAHWGESSQGDWTLRIEDETGGNVGTLNSWSLSFLGDTQTADDLYVYTDEYASASGARILLEDVDGGADTINLAAVTSGSTVDLAIGGTVAGNALLIAPGSIIENLYTGDGNDSLTGNEADNYLYGGRGDDHFYGSAGDDTLDGAQGSDTAFYDFDIGEFLIGLVNDAVVTLNHVVRGFTDTLNNFEFFNFNGKNFSRQELNDYVSGLGAAIPSDLQVSWDGGETQILNDTIGTFLYSGEELGLTGVTQDVLSVTRGETTIVATAIDSAYGGLDKVKLGSDELTAVTFHDFEDVTLYQKQAVADLTINVHQAVRSVVLSGHGNDVINIINDTDGARSRVKSGDGDDVFTSTGNIKDSFFGGFGHDVAFGGAGDDRLEGQDGDDTLYGQGGKDVLRGGNGNDHLEGAEDKDILYGGNGQDHLYGGEEFDVLYGDADHDWLYGEAGADKLNGGSGNDMLFGGSDNDTLSGDDHNDRLEGGEGNDILQGGNGDDILIGGLGKDYLFGGSGEDIFVLSEFDNNVDQFNDFNAAEDILNISDILTGYDSQTDDLSDFIKFVSRPGGQVEIRINQDGDNGGIFTKVAAIYGNSGGLNVEDMLAAGRLIADQSV